jgi:hypothetical protein
MTRFFPIVLSLLLAAGLLGCDTTATNPESQVVVEAYLQGGAPMNSVRLTRSVSTDATYRPDDAAVRNATVEVRRLATDGTTATTIPFEEISPGVYAPASRPAPRVHPRTTYELSVVTDDTEITATTTVPDTLSIVDTQNEQVPYQSNNQPTFTVTPPQSNRSGQSVLVLTTTSRLDFSQPESELRNQLTPFYREDYEPEEDSLETFRTTSSGILNEANFTRDERGRITTTLPWIAVAFYGPNETAVHVVDDNLFDVIRSQQAQSPGGQGTGLGPGELPNVIEHVNGGTGVFGSYVRDAREITIERPTDR